MRQAEQARRSSARAGGVVPVLFVVHQTGVRANGGVESLAQILKQLTRTRAIIATQLETPATEAWRQAGLEVYPLPDVDMYRSTTRASRVAGLLASNARIASLVRRTGARVVHCNDISAFMHAGPGARAAGARLLFNVRDTKAPGERYGVPWLAAAHLCDVFVTLSREMADELTTRVLGRSWPALRAQMEFVYSIVDFSRMGPIGESEKESLRQRLGIRPDARALIYVAAVTPKKAQLKFIESVLPLLSRTAPEAEVYFVGDYDPASNAYARQCAAAVERLELSGRVHFAGFQGDISQWYQAADMTVIASEREGMARAMIESMACGTPVVSFGVCSAREVLEEHGCGVVVSHGDHQALAHEIVALLRDQDRQRTFGLAASSVARRMFSASRAAEQYERLYGELSAR